MNMERFPALSEPCRVQCSKANINSKEKRTSGRREKRTLRCRWIVVHAARHMSKKGRDTLPGLCQGALRLCFATLLRKSRTVLVPIIRTMNSTHCKVLLTEKGCQAWAKGAAAEWQNGGALGAKTLEMDEVNEIDAS